MKRIAIDWENNSENFWSNVLIEMRHGLDDVPATCHPLIVGSSVYEVIVPDEDAAGFLTWCQRIPGWDTDATRDAFGKSYAPHPITFEDYEDTQPFDSSRYWEL